MFVEGFVRKGLTQMANPFSSIFKYTIITACQFPSFNVRLLMPSGGYRQIRHVR